ncbi:DUF2272 domain-containing protein [Variovorax sp. KK3]|uniref:DUF2272 domain-containing protein n=1 Tax=Variovorax sp. KK3 TaxID=1855728 RepID=UPI0021177BF8|nr:DUF2272 domain-containing protein [Variovorax sp. KK3]
MKIDGVSIPRALQRSVVAAAMLAGAIVHGTGHAQPGPVCLQTGTGTPSPPRALALAGAARQEHRAFGGQTLDAEGRLTASGASEAEALRGPSLRPAPWQRVIGYWQAVGTHGGRLPSQVAYGGWRPADRSLLQQALNQASAEHLQGLGVGPDQGLTSQELRALRIAVDRVAVIDTPWSAAFVSWLAREAGLGPDEFAFSEAHADYAGAAWQAGAAEASGQATAYAMRACDAMRTPPRVGDLVCHARSDDARVADFASIGRLLASRATGGAALPMHCDVVVSVDDGGLDAVGGNVLQSVTLRRLDFVPGTRRIDPSYVGCEAGTAGCVDRHMSRAPWSLLLQWR